MFGTELVKQFIMLLMFILFSLTASADVRFEAFAWRADNTFEVRASASQPHTFKGLLNDAQRIEVVSGPVTMTAKSFSGAFVILTFVEAEKELGNVIVLERQNGSFFAIQNVAIKGRSSTLAGDVEGAVTGLGRLNNWDSSLSIRSMLAFFDANPDKKLSDFYDAVELGHIKTVARPNVKGSSPPRRLAAPKAEPEFEQRVAPSPPPRRERREPMPSAAPPPPRREPLPYEPRNSPSWGTPKVTRESDYPGQRIRQGPPPSTWSREPSRRKPKTLFDLLFP